MLRGPFFQAWGSLTRLRSQTQDPQLEVTPGGLVLRIFKSWKNPSTSAGFEPANLGARGEHVTPRPSRPTTFTLILPFFIRWTSKKNRDFTEFSYCPVPFTPKFTLHLKTFLLIRYYFCNCAVSYRMHPFTTIDSCNLYIPKKILSSKSPSLKTYSSYNLLIAL